MNACLWVLRKNVGVAGYAEVFLLRSQVSRQAFGLVADKLSGMCKVEREEYEKYWDDISPFIKFGCLKDDKFCEKMKDYMLFKNLEGKYLTLEDYVKAAKEASGETEETPIVENADGTSATGENADGEGAEEKKQVVYYVTDERQQSQYINMFK